MKTKNSSLVIALNKFIFFCFQVYSVSTGESAVLFFFFLFFKIIPLVNVEEKVAVIHRGRCNNKVYYRLSHDVVT